MLAKGKPNMGRYLRKHRLTTEQRRELAMLADAGRNGVPAAIMLANGFKTKMLAHLERERVRDSNDSRAHEGQRQAD
jgi:hypothetical protein